MTAADRVLVLALARRYPCPSCEATLPSRVSCLPRPDGLLDVVSVVCPDAQRQRRAEKHAPIRPNLRVAS